MIPGGRDVVLQTRFGADDSLANAVAVIQKIWGSVIVDVGKPSEIFVYRSREAANAWDEFGWNEKYAKDMIHLIVDLDPPGDLVIVLESLGDSTLAQILEGVREAIKP